MIPELIKAHQQLDRAVEKTYGKLFEDDRERVAFLFEVYQNKHPNPAPQKALSPSFLPHN
jgi:hypothetical protein